MDEKIIENNEKLALNAFLKQASYGVLIDVRSPGEFKKGHIPGAKNFPLFNDLERAEVGTIYVKQSRQEAIEKGLEFVGPKMICFVQQVKELIGKEKNKPVCVYCWRGGMRSNSMAWLMKLYGLNTFVLQGGYKAYRNGLSDLLYSNRWQFILLGGFTGCGKTEVLQQLLLQGEQVLDLERLANHKGSVFGHLGEVQQPTTEDFGNLIHNSLRQFNPNKRVWIEAESLAIGAVFIPEILFSMMKEALLVLYNIPLTCRINRLCREYGRYDKRQLSDAFQKISARLGAERTNYALQLIADNQLDSAAEIALKYYDKSYTLSLAKLKNKDIIQVSMSEDNSKLAAKKLLRLINKF